VHECLLLWHPVSAQHCVTAAPQLRPGDHHCLPWGCCQHYTPVNRVQCYKALSLSCEPGRGRGRLCLAVLWLGCNARPQKACHRGIYSAHARCGVWFVWMSCCCNALLGAWILSGLTCVRAGQVLDQALLRQHAGPNMQHKLQPVVGLEGATGVCWHGADAYCHGVHCTPSLLALCLLYPASPVQK